jgi:amino acid transporter
MSGETPERGGLARGSIGLKEVVFQSVAFMGPGATLASSLPLVMAFAGGAAVTACLLALVIMVLVAVSVAQLAERMPSAGSFATYASHGIGPRAGFIVGWVYLLLTLLVAPLLVLILASLMSSATGTEDLWWLWVIGSLVAVLGINVRGVQTSSKMNVALGLIEVGLFAFLSLWLIVKAGGDNTVSVFGTAFADVPGHVGFAGIIAGAAYCVLAFSGFEAAAPMAEEARDPRRAIPRAVLYSLLVIAGIEIVSVYAVTVAVGPDHALDFSQVTGGLGQGWRNLADTLFGLGGTLVVFAVLNSCLANANAGVNTSTRTLFALGRVKLLPEELARVDPRWKSPTVAIAVQAVVAFVIALGLGAGYDPAVAFGIVGTAITLAFVFLYMSVHVSSLLYFRRHGASTRSLLPHLIVPVVGFLLLVPELFVASGIQVFDFIAPIPAPFSYGAIAVLAWIPLGAAYLAFTSRRHPSRVAAMTTGLEVAGAHDAA